MKIAFSFCMVGYVETKYALSLHKLILEQIGYYFSKPLIACNDLIASDKLIFPSPPISH